MWKSSSISDGWLVFFGCSWTFNLLGCERLDYHPGSGEKNVWYVTMPKFVDYKPNVQEQPKKINQPSEMDDDFHTGKFRT